MYIVKTLAVIEIVQWIITLNDRRESFNSRVCIVTNPDSPLPQSRIPRYMAQVSPSTYAIYVFRNSLSF